MFNVVAFLRGVGIDKLLNRLYFILSLEKRYRYCYFRNSLAQRFFLLRILNVMFGARESVVG
jgi:hypothetical protein